MVLGIHSELVIKLLAVSVFRLWALLGNLLAFPFTFFIHSQLYKWVGFVPFGVIVSSAWEMV